MQLFYVQNVGLYAWHQGRSVSQKVWDKPTYVGRHFLPNLEKASLHRTRLFWKKLMKFKTKYNTSTLFKNVLFNNSENINKIF